MHTARLIPELYCTDITTSLLFYVDLIGFEILWERKEEKFVYLDLNGAQLMLEEQTFDATSERTWWTGPAQLPLGRGINFEIAVDDVNHLYERVIEAKCPVFREIENKWYQTGEIQSGNRQFLVQDPDGYLLRFAGALGERS